MRDSERLNTGIAIIEDDGLEVSAQSRHPRWSCATTKIQEHPIGCILWAVQRPQQLDDFADMFLERSNNASLVINESIHWGTHWHAFHHIADFLALLQEPKSHVVDFQFAGVGHHDEMVSQEHGLLGFGPFRAGMCVGVHNHPEMLLNREPSGLQRVRPLYTLSG